MARSQFKTLKFWLKVLLGMSLAIGLAIAFPGFHLQTLLQSILLWVKSLGSVGVIAFVVVYNVATVLLIPASLLTLGGGALYGVVWGSVYVIVASMLGAIIAFAIGRYCARNWVCQQIQAHPKFKLIDQAVAQDGMKIVLLTRLSPLFPFNLLNYVFGITCIPLKDYVFGSVGIIPGTVMYVYIGSLLGIAALEMPQDITHQAQLVQWSIRFVGLLTSGAVMFYLTRIAKRSLNQSVMSDSL
jgi:uncharacterized membrane protein YdjX (TVP38/TMEM64 family)